MPSLPRGPSAALDPTDRHRLVRRSLAGVVGPRAAGAARLGGER